MNNQDYGKLVLAELNQTLLQIAVDSSDAFVALLQEAPAVFCAGAGRSGFQMKGFAMRLMHLGIVSYVVGETTTPSIKQGDLLVIGSGSGETRSLVEYAQKAKSLGVRVALITIDAQSTIAHLADVVITIPSSSPKVKSPHEVVSKQPMASLFEQTEGIFLDIVIMMLMDVRKIDAGTMYERHANLE